MRTKFGASANRRETKLSSLAGRLLHGGVEPDDGAAGRGCARVVVGEVGPADLEPADLVRHVVHRRGDVVGWLAVPQPPCEAAGTLPHLGVHDPNLHLEADTSVR